MTKNTKKVDELEVGDMVILPYHKDISTVSKIQGVRYKISLEGVKDSCYYDYDNDVTYFGNKNTYLGNKNKKEKGKIVELEVDYSLFSPLDNLINEVSNYSVLDIPVALIHQLKKIYELFEGVLDITFVDLKKLYFERSKLIPKLNKTKKVKDLCIGDKFQIPSFEGEQTVTKLEYFSTSKIKVSFNCDIIGIYNSDTELTISDE